MSRFSSRLAFFGDEFPSGNIPDLFWRLHRCSKDKNFHILALFMEDVLIGHHEATDEKYDLGDAGTTLTGLSVGLLSGAAVATSTSLSDLAYYGVESVRIAFRMGIHVDRVSQSLESRESDSSPKAWAYVVTGVSAEA
ncbi:uncharacterized protein N7473_003927 [Penicillium subrubescens]|uniref:uncharacterized protein n=1 Tax=Penicillium subrubescens TaxID=1316194 RepID=UPI002545A32C|nr:uncharacterized protein N7473_003927 [Penicillium subrubescens]KAJ5907011.1 hypothetical protein N7473_003927 [Penicillium subrubescens]